MIGVSPPVHEKPQTETIPDKNLGKLIRKVISGVGAAVLKIFLSGFL
jgi:hypothetical protein